MPTGALTANNPCDALEFETAEPPNHCSCPHAEDETGWERLKIRHYELKAPDAPAALRRCAEMGSASAVTLQGGLGILDKRLLGFFCSVRCPGDVILKTYDLARALRETDVTIVGGFQSPMEKECLDLLLRGSASVVVCPARGLDALGRVSTLDQKHPLFKFQNRNDR
ncbi:MAG: hypothetical protein J4F42_02490 [Desulfurellaceae bacterium]|nr:hypothetical protein [Desulfurellaceae bacterium]